MENLGRKSVLAFKVDFSESQIGTTLISGIICKMICLPEHPGTNPISKK
jgi:hypothetical protein